MSPYNIVLADDHVIVRQGIRRIIEEDPNLRVVAEVGNGLTLLEILHGLNVDLVIMDITMPSLSGTEATKRIKLGFPRVKVLILTMHKGKELLHHAIAAGADGYLIKEDADRELLLGIETLRRGGTYISHLLFPLLEEFFIQTHRGGEPSKVTESLTAREIEIVKLIAEGRSSKEIAEVLCLSYRTIQNHRTKIMRKLRLNKNTDLVRFALLKGYAYA